MMCWHFWGVNELLGVESRKPLEIHEGCTIEASILEIHSRAKSFSCCWKDVRLKHIEKVLPHIRPRFQLLLKGCTIEAAHWLPFSLIPYCFSCCWKDVRLKPDEVIEFLRQLPVSVVVERMYDWSAHWLPFSLSIYCFSCCWKDVRLKPIKLTLSHEAYSFSCCWKDVRLKQSLAEKEFGSKRFQLLLKGCTIEADKCSYSGARYPGFSCCWKDVRLKLKLVFNTTRSLKFQLLLKGCTIEAHGATLVTLPSLCFSCCWKDVRLKLANGRVSGYKEIRFSCCWKDVRLKRPNIPLQPRSLTVSVVVERMYDWSNVANVLAKSSIMFQLLLKGCTIEALRRILSRRSTHKFQLLLKGCTIEAQKILYAKTLVERFQLLLKGCTIEATGATFKSFPSLRFSCCWKDVRLKQSHIRLNQNEETFQLLLKGCTIEAQFLAFLDVKERSFSCCWKDVRLKPCVEIGLPCNRIGFSCCWKDVRLKLYGYMAYMSHLDLRFSCCWKDVRLKLRNQLIENKWFLTVGFWSVFRKWSICTKSAIIFENLGWFGWLLDCFW